MGTANRNASPCRTMDTLNVFTTESIMPGSVNAFRQPVRLHSTGCPGRLDWKLCTIMMRMG